MEFLSQMPRILVGFISPLIERFNKSKFYKSVAWVAGGMAVAQAIAILSAPIVTRLYTPSDYGVFAVFVAILGVLQPVSTLTYSMAIPLAQDNSLAHDVLKICLLVTLAISLFLALVIFTAGPFIAVYFSIQHAVRYLWLLPICLFGVGLYETLSSWAVR